MKTCDQTPHGATVTERLITRIKGMSEEQQSELLNLLEAQQDQEKRELPRKPHVMPVEYAAEGRVHRDVIQNISSGGVFIETQEQLPVGQEISMTFKLPDSELPIKLRGEIIRTSPEGIGVRFKWQGGT